MAVDPKCHSIAPYQMLPIVRERRVQDGACMRVFLQRTQCRGVVRDYYSWAVERLRELSSKPIMSLLRLFNQVSRPDAAVIFRANLAKIAQLLLRTQSSQA